MKEGGGGGDNYSKYNWCKTMEFSVAATLSLRLFEIYESVLSLTVSKHATHYVQCRI